MGSNGREDNADNGIVVLVLSRYESRVALLIHLGNLRWLLVKNEILVFWPVF